VAEAKHFGGYGGSSKDGAPVETSMGTLHDVYLRPWQAFAAAGGRALMASHNDINGRPCHSNPTLLTKIMREDFGFGDALIASDGHDVNRVFYTGTCTDAVDAAVQCLAAGMDQDLGGMSFGPRCDPRNTTIYGCGAAVTEGGTCPHCPIDPYGEENARSSILLTGIRQGRVEMTDIDRATRNVLRAKFAARRFDDAKYRDPAMVGKFVRNKEHIALARSAAAEGCVLLKNVAPPPPPPPLLSNCSGGMFHVGYDWGGSNNQSYKRVKTIDECCNWCAETRWCNHFALTSTSMDCYLKGGERALVPSASSTAGYCKQAPPPPGPLAPPPPPPVPALPLDKTKVKHVAVMGPNAADAHAQLGQYECTQDTEVVVTVEQGIRNAVAGQGVNVTYSPGADWHNPGSLASRAPPIAMVNAAVLAAKAADVAVLVLGDNTATCGEANDRSDLDLPGSQLDLLHAVTTGAPGTLVVVVLVNCRPATFGSGGPGSKWGPEPNALLANVDALLVAWNCGAQGGNAVADLLFGAASPSGRLASNWLSSVGAAAATGNTWGLDRQQSDYDSQFRSDSPTHNPVAFPFGAGLDYLEVERSAPTLSSSNISSTGSTTLSVPIKNNHATRGGGYAVQVYFRQRVSKIARPQLQLANFTKVWLPAGGKTVVASVEIQAQELGYYDSWLGKHVVDIGHPTGVYDLLVCADSSCGGCNGAGRAAAMGCLEKLPHATLSVHA
jgi:beta-glucosidase-like glycosyl hydrolase